MLKITPDPPDKSLEESLAHVSGLLRCATATAGKPDCYRKIARDEGSGLSLIILDQGNAFAPTGINHPRGPSGSPKASRPSSIQTRQGARAVTQCHIALSGLAP